MDGSFPFRQGPIFCHVLLADEINRASPRTQSALLEAMGEAQATIEGRRHPLPKPFLVLATQNPIEQEGVYRLPEAQLDRFLFRIEVGYPARDREVDMLDLHSRQIPTPSRLTTAAEIVAIQQSVDLVFGTRELQEYIVDLVRASRQHPDLVLGGSPRAAIFLMRAARARALLMGRAYLTHDDVQTVALPVLGHRLILKPESEMEGRRVPDIVDEIVKSVPVLKSSM